MQGFIPSKMGHAMEHNLLYAILRTLVQKPVKTIKKEVVTSLKTFTFSGGKDDF